MRFPVIISLAAITLLSVQANAETRASVKSGRIADSAYPLKARKLGMSGRTYVSFTVNPKGRAEQCGVVTSSGHPELDLATCDIAIKNFRFTPATDSMGAKKVDYMTFAISWSPPKNLNVEPMRPVDDEGIICIADCNRYSQDIPLTD